MAPFISLPIFKSFHGCLKRKILFPSLFLGHLASICYITIKSEGATCYLDLHTQIMGGFRVLLGNTVFRTFYQNSFAQTCIWNKKPQRTACIALPYYVIPTLVCWNNLLVTWLAGTLIPTYCFHCLFSAF